MKTSLLEALNCPFCGGSLEIKGRPEEYGILNCHCGRYPVIAGIPVLKKDRSGFLDGVMGLIEKGKELESLRAIIAPLSPSLAPAWVRSVPMPPYIVRLATEIAHKLKLARWNNYVLEMICDPGQSTAMEFLNKYFFGDEEVFYYFAFRFGQPRHLVGLSFISLIDNPSKPLLDLGCGCGHLTRGLAHRSGGQPVIGIDDFFAGLFVAKHWISPESDFICMAGDGALPFPDSYFHVSFCSDALHYFKNKTVCMRELKRTTSNEGAIMLVWVHNGLQRSLPHDGNPLPPEGYLSLFSDMPCRALSASDVLSEYLEGRGPALAGSGNNLSGSLLLCMLGSRNQDYFKDFGKFKVWPHAVGTIGLNPLYIRQNAKESGELNLRLSLPSRQYGEDHREMKEYMPQEVHIQADVLDEIKSGAFTPGVRELIEKFVLLDIPEKFWDGLRRCY